MGWQKTNSGGVNRSPVRLVIANDTCTINDGLIEGDCTAGNMTETLPLASTAIGLSFKFTKVDNTAFVWTIDAAGSELINGAANYQLSHQYDEVEVTSDGIVWVVTEFYSQLADPNN